MLNARIVIAAMFWSFTTTQAVAQEKDLRTKTDSSGETVVGFCSRPSPDAFGFPGHAFVLFSEISPKGTVKFRAIGHTVATKNLPAIVITYFGGRPVAGKQSEERFTHMKQACLSVKVDRNVFERAVAAAKPTLTVLGLNDDVAASAENYALNGTDCIDFAAKVAQALEGAGLKQQTRRATDTPLAFVQRLIEQNR